MTNTQRTAAALRIYLGVFWLIYGTSKLDSFWLRANGQFRDTVQSMNSETAGFYHQFVSTFVLSHVLLFASLIAVGETLVGVSLLLGLFTRAGAVGCMFLTLNYWLAGGQYAHGKWSIISLEAVVFFMSVLVLLLPSDSVWSVDGRLLRARRRFSADRAASG